MMNILKVTFVIIGTLIGAGFASGQEMYLFFYSYGINGIYGIVLSAFLMGFIIYKVLNIINKCEINNYKELLEVLLGKYKKVSDLNIKNIFNIIVNFFTLITFFVMVAGFGTYFEQELGINHFIGSSCLAFLCFIIFKTSIKGLVKANEIIIPILIFLIFFIGIMFFFKINTINVIENISSQENIGWLLSCILYTSYNSILLIPVLITLNKYLNNKKSIISICLATTIIIIILAFILFCILGSIDVEIKQIEMPVVYAVGNIFKCFKAIYGFVIIASIFTTSISMGTSFLQNVVKNKKCYTHIAVMMCITSVIISCFSFSNLVSLLYPIFGYLGLIQICLLL